MHGAPCIPRASLTRGKFLIMDTFVKPNFRFRDVLKYGHKFLIMDLVFLFMDDFF